MEWLVTLGVCVVSLLTLWGTFKLSKYVMPLPCAWSHTTEIDGHCSRCGKDWENFQRPQGCTDPQRH